MPQTTLDLKELRRQIIGVDAFIQTQDRSVVSYLVKPLSNQIARAFREE